MALTGSNRPHQRLDPDDQVPLHGLRALDEPTIKEMFTGEAADSLNKWDPLPDNDKDMRRNHFPPGAVKE